MAGISHQLDIAKVRGIQRLDGVLEGTVSRIKERGTSPQYPTGLEGLDDQIWGVHKKELITIGARPAEGKTSFAMQIAWNIANANSRALFLSLEMSKEQLVERLLSHVMEINNTELRRGVISEENASKIEAFRKITEELPMLITDNIGYNMNEIEYLVANAEPAFDVVILDYIQLCQLGAFRNRVDAITEYLRMFKELCVRYDFAAVMLSQINRAATDRQDKRPKLQDLKGCVHENTIIEGTTIKDWYKKNLYEQVPSYDIKQGKYVKRYPAKIVDSGKKECYEITTKSGKKIIVSDSTKLLSLNKWVKAGALNKGDTITVVDDNTGTVCTNSGKTWFPKGNVPWNKDKKMVKTKARIEYDNRQRGTSKAKPPDFSKTMQKANPPIGRKIKYNSRPSSKRYRVWRDGYVFIYKPEYISSRQSAPDRGYILEHRYVMENSIGRQLTRKEVIHHIDGMKSNNKITNLLLCKNASVHNSIHGKMNFFVESLIRKGKVYYDTKKETFCLRG